jgi:hypothetical protein
MRYSSSQTKTLGSELNSSMNDKFYFEMKRLVPNETKSSSISNGSDLEYGYQGPGLPLKDAEWSHRTPDTTLEPRNKIGPLEFDKQEKSSLIFSEMKGEAAPMNKQRKSELVKQPSLPTSIEQEVQNWSSSRAKNPQTYDTLSPVPISDTPQDSDASYMRIGA